MDRKVTALQCADAREEIVGLQPVAAVAGLEDGRCRRHAQAMTLERLHRARQMPGAADQQDLFELHRSQGLGRKGGIFEGVAAAVLHCGDRDPELLLQDVAHQGAGCRLLFGRTAATDDQRQPGAPLQPGGITYPLQGGATDAVSAVLRRAGVATRGEHHDGLRFGRHDVRSRQRRVGLERLDHAMRHDRQAQRQQE